MLMEKIYLFRHRAAKSDEYVSAERRGSAASLQQGRRDRQQDHVQNGRVGPGMYCRIIMIK